MAEDNPPDAALAAVLARAATGRAPVDVRRFTTGSMHYVFDVRFADRDPVVARIAGSWGVDAMRGASKLSHLLRPLGVPLPKILAEDLHAAAPYLILERLPGTDLGDVVGTLSSPALEAIAAEVVRSQRIVATTPSAGRYGYAASPPEAPYTRWSDVLRADLERSHSRIAAAGLFDLAVVATAADLVERFAAPLDAQAATPFLHDTTTKNVIVTPGGAFSGIVDVDDLCFGDPRFAVALTLVALLAHGESSIYADIWMKAAGLSSDALFRLYVLTIVIGFMSEHGQTFNGNQPLSRAEDRAHLTRLYMSAIDQIAG
jgi:aminoglycoside phosphotransferase (APT) family kinase protein